MLIVFIAISPDCYEKVTDIQFDVGREKAYCRTEGAGGKLEPSERNSLARKGQRME